MYKKLKVLTAAVLLCCAPLAASADVISFDFTTFGNASLTSAGVQLNGTTSTTGLESYFGGTSPTFSFSGLLNQFGMGSALGYPPDAGWKMSDGAGDSLFGSFGATVLGSVEGFFYTVTGGTGAFYGAYGNGGSLASFWGNEYGEQGAMVVAVPEPGMISLFVAGLLALGWAVRRQRRGALLLGKPV